MKISFKRNLGNLDRILRGSVGLVFLGTAALSPFPLSSTWTAILIILGIAMLIESALGY